MNFEKLACTRENLTACTKEEVEKLESLKSPDFLEFYVIAALVTLVFVVFLVLFIWRLIYLKKKYETQKEIISTKDFRSIKELRRINKRWLAREAWVFVLLLIWVFTIIGLLFFGLRNIPESELEVSISAITLLIGGFLLVVRYSLNHDLSNLWAGIHILENDKYIGNDVYFSELNGKPLIGEIMGVSPKFTEIHNADGVWYVSNTELARSGIIKKKTEIEATAATPAKKPVTKKK